MTANAELPPLDDLDLAFTLPEHVTDPHMRQLYEVLVARMRREASHMTMSTVQQLLIERIAYNYIIMRVKEAAAGTQDGFAHATAQKEFNTFWLSMTQEFNRQLKSTDTDFRASVLDQLKSIITAVISEVEDAPTQKRMRDRLADALEDAGL
jgi:hypothetical protein